MENTNGRWAEKLQDFQKDPPSLTLASFSQMAYSAPILFSQYLKNIGIILEMDGDTNGQLNNKKFGDFLKDLLHGSSLDVNLFLGQFAGQLIEKSLK